MPKRSKRIRAARELVNPQTRYLLKDALKILKSFPPTRFDQSVDVAVRLGIDPKKTEEAVRGSVNLPHGTGKTVRVLVFAKGEKEAEARAAGADHVGGEELVDKIANEGWLDFDKAIATPDMMRVVGKIARILGPRGMMPNPKVGTVTMDVKAAVEDLKGGKVMFRVDKAGIIHCGVGRISFGEKQLEDNIVALLDGLQKLRPSTAKGLYFRGFALSGTMTPAIRLDPTQVDGLLKERAHD